MNDEIIYSTNEVARLFGLTRGRITQLIHAGVIPASKWGRDWQIKALDLARFKRIRQTRNGEVQNEIVLPKYPPPPKG